MSHETSTIPFSVSVATGILATACARVSLQDNNARLIRLGENALFHLPAESVVVRIARTMDYWDDALNEDQIYR